MLVDRFGKRLFEYDHNTATGSSVFDDGIHDNDEEYFKESHEHIPHDKNDKDIPYMLENGMLSDEDIRYLREEKGMLLDEEINESKVERINDKGDEVPEKCDKCGSHIGLYLKGEPVWLCSNKKCSKYFGTAPCNFQEATTDNKNKMIPVTNFKFNKVYYGDPIKRTNYMTCDDDRPLFATPYPGLASIFSGRYNIIKILREKGCRRYNLGYDEWGLDLSELKEPLSEVHVRVEGYPDLESFTCTFEGYIHTIEVSNIKHNLYQYPWMTDGREVLITNMKEIPVEKVEKVKVTYIVSGAESHNTFQESSQSNKQKPKEIDWEIDEWDREEQPENDLDSFGSDIDGTSPNNDYDQEEINVLNELIASESSAIGEYLDAAKNTNVDILRRLYSDIGDEERFHSEQLMFAKTTLTGEKYEPRDPDVKREYEELLALGMDEETAMTTAVDKLSLNNEHDDYTDSDIQEIKDDIEVLEAALHQCSANLDTLETICESTHSFSKEELDRHMNIFIESYCYMETVDNLTDEKMYQKKSQGPIRMILNAFSALLKLISQIVKKIKMFVKRILTKNKRQREWIKSHGIKALFSSGISMYFYSDKQPDIISIEPLRYIDLMNRITIQIARKIGFNEPLPNTNNNNFEPIRFNSISHGLDLVKGVLLTKSKVVVTSSNEAELANIFFGYTDDKTASGKSKNIYHALEAVSDAAEICAKGCNSLVEWMMNLERDPHSIYYKDRESYNKAVKSMKVINDGFKMFTKALTHDMNVVMKLNNGILEQTRKADEAGVDPNKLNETKVNNGEIDW